VRKVAATAIRTRSNPARLVEQSRIVTPLGETAPSWNSSWIVYRPSQLSPACNDSHMHTIHAPPACSQHHAGNSRQTDFRRFRFQPITRFCHAPFALSVTSKQRFKCSGIANVLHFKHRSVTIRHCLSLPRLLRRPPTRRRRHHRVCGRASSGRFSIGVRPRTSARDNARSRTG